MDHISHTKIGIYWGPIQWKCTSSYERNYIVELTV